MCCKFSYISNYLVTGKIQIKGTCSGTYDNNKQEITSPNYPRNYHNSKTCTWKLEAPQGRRIGLKFLDFDLEQSSGCRYDWLKVYNGGSDSSPVLKDKLCGASRPSNTASSGNQLFLKFHTDGDASKTGFKIAYNLKCEYHYLIKIR